MVKKQLKDTKANPVIASSLLVGLAVLSQFVFLYCYFDKDVNKLLNPDHNGVPALLSWKTNLAAIQRAWSHTTVYGGALIQKLYLNEDTPLPDFIKKTKGDWPVDVFYVFIWLVMAANWGVRLFVVKPIARVLLKQGRRRLPADETHVDKFSQSALENFIYSGFLFMSIPLLIDQTWLWPSKNWWVDKSMSFAGKDQADLSHHLEILPLALRAYYVLYCARYVQGLISLFFEAIRKDFVEMIIHHVVTATLIYFSWLGGYVRVGLVVMSLFDWADPPLHIAKLFKYIDTANNKGIPEGAPKNNSYAPLLADIWFAIFAIAFTGSRIGLYAYVVWSAHVETLQTWYSDRFFSIYNPIRLYSFWMTEVDVKPFICVICLAILYFLQVFWEMLLLKAIKKVLFSGKLEDNRSDSELSDSED
eukprot:g1125.t1